MGKTKGRSTLKSSIKRSIKRSKKRSKKLSKNNYRKYSKKLSIKKSKKNSKKRYMKISKKRSRKTKRKNKMKGGSDTGNPESNIKDSLLKCKYTSPVFKSLEEYNKYMEGTEKIKRLNLTSQRLKQAKIKTEMNLKEINKGDIVHVLDVLDELDPLDDSPEDDRVKKERKKIELIYCYIFPRKKSEDQNSPPHYTAYVPYHVFSGYGQDVEEINYEDLTDNLVNDNLRIYDSDQGMFYSYGTPENQDRKKTQEAFRQNDSTPIDGSVKMYSRGVKNADYEPVTDRVGDSSYGPDINILSPSVLKFQGVRTSLSPSSDPRLDDQDGLGG